MDPREARHRFASARVARLATVAADGAPHLVPVVFAVTGDRIHTAVDAKPKRTTALRRLANIAAEPRVALLVDHYDEDWSTLWWIRVDGEGRVVDDGLERDRAVAALAAKYPQYRRQAPPGAVVTLTTTSWRSWP